MSCPSCRLINPPSAARCDCGYDFSTGTVKQSYLESRHREQFLQKKTLRAVGWSFAAMIAFRLALALGARLVAFLASK